VSGPIKTFQNRVKNYPIRIDGTHSGRKPLERKLNLITLWISKYLRVSPIENEIVFDYAIRRPFQSIVVIVPR